MASICLNGESTRFCITSYFQTNEGFQFVSKHFTTGCEYLDDSYVAATAYFAQSNQQVKKCNRPIVTRLRHYVADRQQDWTLKARPATYVYKVKSRCETSPWESTLTLDQQHQKIFPICTDSAMCQKAPQTMRIPILARTDSLRLRVDLHMRNS